MAEMMTSEYNSVGLVAISEISAKQDNLFRRTFYQILYTYLQTIMVIKHDIPHAN